MSMFPNPAKRYRSDFAGVREAVPPCGANEVESTSACREPPTPQSRNEEADSVKASQITLGFEDCRKQVLKMCDAVLREPSKSVSDHWDNGYVDAFKAVHACVAAMKPKLTDPNPTQSASHGG